MGRSVRDREGGADVEARVERLLASERGAGWAARLLRRDDVRGRAMGRIALGALDRASDRAGQDALVQRLVALGHEDLRALGLERVWQASSRQVQGLLRSGFGVSDKLGFEIARRGLGHPDVGIKTQILKHLADHPSEDVLALLAHAAGWKGDKGAIKLLALGPEDRRLLPRLQLAAVGSLGLSRSPLAVRPLLELVTQTKLIEDQTSEDLRIAAAQALLTNGTPPAKTALDQIARHKKRAVRDVATRVLQGRR